MDIKIDPEFQALIPPLTDEERKRLEANIVADKTCREPLAAWKGHGLLLDGHNRKEICDHHGIGYRVAEVELADRDAALLWIIHNQLGRRNLNDMQRSELALSQKSIIERDVQRRPKQNTATRQNSDEQNTATRQNSDDGRRTDDEVGKSAGVSRDTIRKVETMKESGDDAVIDMARKGEVSIDAAAKVAKLPKAEQKAVAAAGPKAVKAKAKEMRATAKKPKAPKPAQAEPVTTEPATPAEPEKPADPPTDEVGNPITDPAIAEAFASRPAYDETLELLRQVAAKVNALRGNLKDGKPHLPGGFYLTENNLRQSFDVDFKNVRNALTFAKPYALCPYPHTKTTCQVCKGLGWVVKESYERAPKSYKLGRGAA